MEYLILKDSIRDIGIIQSLLVRPVGDGYEVIAGYHRFEVALDLKLDTVPCIVKNLSDKDILRIQVIENSNRINTNPIDYCRRLQRIVHSGEMTIDELAYSIHRHPDWVRNLLSLNYLSKKAKESLDKRKISCKIAIELAKLPISKQDQLLDLKEDLSNTDYLEVVRSSVRNTRVNKKKIRIEAKKQRPESFRSFREVKDEYLNRVDKAVILIRKKAQTASDGWDAALEWVLQCDEESLAKREKSAKKAKELELRKAELRKLEYQRRQNEQRIDNP